MIPTLDHAKGILEPHHPLIRRVIDEAWAEWRDMAAWRASKGFPPILYPRVIADYMFDGIARRGILAFGALDAVHVEVEAQTFKLHFRGLSARFKKGGEDKLGRNHHTQTSLAFVEADGLLPGLPPETGKVEFIWLPNELMTDLKQVLVIARDGDKLIWEYEIKPSAGSATIHPLPSAPDEPDAGAPPLVTPKPGTKVDRKDDTKGE